MAQGPLYDRITVNVPYAINVNGTNLPAGDYEIRQHESAAGGSRIVHFYSDNGMKLETTAMAIPTVDNRTPEQTKLILEHFGSDYYLNKIWVQGKDYGYEFPLPDNVRNRENERNTPAAVVATYQAPAETVARTETTTTERTEIAQNTPPPAPAEPAPAPVESAQAQPAPEPAPAPMQAAPAPMQADRTMPATAGNWLNLLVGGVLLASSGLALSRVRA